MLSLAECSEIGSCDATKACESQFHILCKTLNEALPGGLRREDPRIMQNCEPATPKQSFWLGCANSCFSNDIISICFKSVVVVFRW